MPSPEFLPIGACIINKNGELQLLSDGSTYLDLREIKFSGSGGASGITAYHQDLLGRDVANAHPASAISIDDSGGFFDGTTVESVLSEVYNKTVIGEIVWAG